MTGQAQWNTLRLDVLVQVASVQLDGDAELKTLWERYRVALTDAFDHPVPAHSVYRQLRTFAVARWPVLMEIVTRPLNQANMRQERVPILSEAIKMLELAVR